MDGSVALRATAWAGGLLAIAAAGQLAGGVIVEIPLDHGAVLPLHGFVPQLILGLVRLAAFALLALRAPQAVGGSVAARIALVLFGARDVVLLLGVPLLPSFPLAVVLNGAVQLALLAAGGVAAVAVVRARSLPRAGRWLLVPVVALGLPQLMLSFVPLPLSADAYVAVAEASWTLQTMLLLAFALALLAHARRDAIQHRWRVIRDAW